MDPPSAGMYAWAEGLGLRRGVDYDPQRTAAHTLLNLVEIALGQKSTGVVARLKPLSRTEYRDLPDHLQQRARRIFDRILRARLEQQGYVVGATIELKGQCYTLESVSPRGNSKIRAADGHSRMITPPTLRQGKIVSGPK